MAVETVGAALHKVTVPSTATTTVMPSDETADEMVDEMAVETVDAPLHTATVLSTVALTTPAHGSDCPGHPRPPVDSPRAMDV
ncbi:MAG: hypothetical protein H6678_09155 [Candidatus Delongbacteria bacterium]|nr:hypothetical protein [Candidatus Delongbacteria bacterium]